MIGQRAPELLGLVLAGGRSRRMGCDKGMLEIGGRPQAARCVTLLEPFCQNVRVSVRHDQAALAPYDSYEQVIDDPKVAGPIAGLLAAWAVLPGRALLVLAVDLMLVDTATLACLVRHRDPARLATAFRHADGTPEPLCTIWEPRAASGLLTVAADGVSPSLRRLLEEGDAAFVVAPQAERLMSCNTAEDYAAARDAFDGP